MVVELTPIALCMQCATSCANGSNGCCPLRLLWYQAYVYRITLEKLASITCSLDSGCATLFWGNTYI